MEGEDSMIYANTFMIYRCFFYLDNRLGGQVGQAHFFRTPQNKRKNLHIQELKQQNKVIEREIIHQ